VIKCGPGRWWAPLASTDVSIADQSFVTMITLLTVVMDGG
jgi:hypothetical protein